MPPCQDLRWLELAVCQNTLSQSPRKNKNNNTAVTSARTTLTVLTATKNIHTYFIVIMLSYDAVELLLVLILGMSDDIGRTMLSDVHR